MNSVPSLFPSTNSSIAWKNLSTSSPALYPPPPPTPPLRLPSSTPKPNPPYPPPRAASCALAKGPTLPSSTPADPPPHPDEDLPRRMLLTLLDNAIKYTPAGGMVNVDCRLDTNSYIVRVSNTGPGIPTDLQSRIFERFFRADEARSRTDGAAGGATLGPSIPRWIADTATALPGLSP